MTVKRERGYGGPLAKAKATTDGKPVWNTIMPAGTFHRKSFPGGKQTFNRKFFERVIANWKQLGGNALPLDRFHWGDSNVKDVRAEDKKAAGFMEDFRVAADGSLEALCNWNDEGRDDILKDRLRYISPEWFWSYVDPQTGEDMGPTLTNASLLNDPFFTGLPRMAASDDPEAPAQEHLMTREELIALYGLTASASDADIKAAAKKGADAAKAAKETAAAGERVKVELEEKLANETAAREAAEKRSIEHEKRTAEIEKTLKETAAKQMEKDAAALCLKLEREGRIIAVQKEDVIEDVKTHGLEKATKRWEKIPAKVSLREIGSGGEGGTETKESAHKKFMELVDAAQKETASLTTRQAFAKVKAAHPEIAKAAFEQN